MTVAILTAAEQPVAQEHEEVEQQSGGTQPIGDQDELEAAAAEPPRQLQRMDATPDLFDWSERINEAFSL